MLYIWRKLGIDGGRVKGNGGIGESKLEGQKMRGIGRIKRRGEG